MSDNVTIIDQVDNITITDSNDNISISDNTTEVNVSSNVDSITITDSVEEISVVDSTDNIEVKINDIVVINQGGNGVVAPSLQRLVDFINDNEVYVGEAETNLDQGVVGWRIYKVDRDFQNGPDCIFADGTETFDKVWNDRATYTY